MNIERIVFFWYVRVPSRPQNAYVKSKVYMAVDSENPRMYQCSRVFALRGFDLRFSKTVSEPMSLFFFIYLC